MILSALTASNPSMLFSIEQDHDANRRVVANEAFYEADEHRNWSLTPEDAGAWGTYSELDRDGNGAVSFEEFASDADLPYPAWPGEVTRNIVYKRAGGENLLLDVYPPIQSSGGKAAPVLFYVHGGGWSGRRKEPEGHIQPIFQALSQQGVACVSIMYRLVKMWKEDDPVVMRDCVVDCFDALRFIVKHADELNLDARRIVVFGDSAGGHLAQLLNYAESAAFGGDTGLEPYRTVVAGAVSWYGPTDFRNLELFESPLLKKEFTREHWARLITKEQKPVPFELAGEMSPARWMTPASPPLLLVHGTLDDVIPVAHAHHLQRLAAEIGAPVQVQLVEGASHGWWNSGIRPSREEIESMTAAFVFQCLQE